MGNNEPRVETLLFWVDKFCLEVVV